MMTDEELATWTETRPEAIRLAVALRDPRKLYRMDTGHIVTIFSYSEHEDRKCRMPDCEYKAKDGVTCTVLVLRRFNPDVLFERKVFGISPEELQEVPAGTVARGKL
jgi:hypothetical protein